MTKKLERTKYKSIKKITKKHSRTVDYHTELIKSLKNHNEAVAYLNAALEESLNGDTESQQFFLIALRNVAEAHGNINKLAKRAKMQPEHVNKILSEEGVHSFLSFAALLRAMGINIQFS